MHINLLYVIHVNKIRAAALLYLIPWHCNIIGLPASNFEFEEAKQNTNNIMGIPEHVLVDYDQAPEIVFCAICDYVADEPIMCTSCQAVIFCRKCIAQWLDKEQQCPQCKATWAKDALTLNRTTQKLIDSLPAVCPNTGCGYTSTYGTLMSSHVPTCPYGEVECKDCRQLFARNALEEHQKVCEYGQTKCECGKDVVRWDLQAHKLDECPLTDITCTDCGITIKRGNVEEHVQVCKKPVPCPNAEIGCEWKGEPTQLEDHISSCYFETMKPLLLQVSKMMQKQNKEQSERIAELEKQVQTLKRENLILKHSVGNAFPSILWKVSLKKYCSEESICTEEFELNGIKWKAVLRPGGTRSWLTGTKDRPDITLTHCGESSWIKFVVVECRASFLHHADNMKDATKGFVLCTFGKNNVLDFTQPTPYFANRENGFVHGDGFLHICLVIKTPFNAITTK